MLFLLNWFTSAILPPRYKQFRDAKAVVEVIRANVSEDDIYTAPPGLFASVSLQPRFRGLLPRLVSQLLAEFAVALGLSWFVLAMPLRRPVSVGSLLGLAGLIAGIETHFPNWNWAGFPTSYLLAGSAYLGVNWFLTGLMLGAIRKNLTKETYL